MDCFVSHVAKWKAVNNFPSKVSNTAQASSVEAVVEIFMLPENLEAVLFSAGGGEVCGTSDQLHFPLTQKRQLGFDFISWRSACCFPSTNDSVFQIFLAPGLPVHNNKWRDLQSVFSVTCKQVFCILTFLEMKKAQLASYHLIWLLFNPPFPIVSVFSNFVSKTYFLCPCHMHTHLDVLCAMLCFMLC